MTAELRLHGKPVSSVFELLGDRENDVTFSLGWALARCPHFNRRFVSSIFDGRVNHEAVSVSLQERDKDGITDIELLGPDFHCIVEAKSGLAIPSQNQLKRYAGRLLDSSAKHRVLVTLSAALEDCVRDEGNRRIRGLLCVHMSLKRLIGLASRRDGSHAEKRLLAELQTYLKRIAHMQDFESNIVFVVALSNQTPKGCQISWREIVTKHNRYFHPVGGGYPPKPVNYLGFRFDGRLQFICHADRWEVVEQIGSRIPGFRFKFSRPHYLYTLGPKVVPFKEVRNGRIVMANRVYAAIDLLLTCSTISEAGQLTRKRQKSLRA